MVGVIYIYHCGLKCFGPLDPFHLTLCVFNYQVEMGLFNKIDNEMYRLLPPGQQAPPAMPPPPQQQPQLPAFIKEEMSNGFQNFPPNCQPMPTPMTPTTMSQNSAPFQVSFPDRPISSEMPFKPSFQMTIPPQPSPPTPTMQQVLTLSHEVEAYNVHLRI